MKFNKWTLGLAAVGVVSMASAVRADETKLSQLNTLVSGTTISGFVDVGAQYNAGNANNWDNAPTTAQGNAHYVDGFSLNALNIAIEKPLDESPWAAGYRIELNTGEDAINASSSTFGVRQAYVALRTPVGNGIDWKIGAFDGITGYEGNTASANPNYTRSYGYLVNPASEVGLLGSYKIINEVTVQAGIANRNSASGSSYFSGRFHESSKNFIFAVALTAPDSWGWAKGSVLNAGTVQTFDNGGINNYSVNATIATPVTGLKFGLAYDKVQGLGWNQQGLDGNIYGVYATYQATQKLGFNVRGEYVDGQNLGFFSNDNNNYVDPYNGSGKGEEVTATIEYDLWANVVSRVEARWDHTESGTQYNHNDADANAFMFALNVVYKF